MADVAINSDDATIPSVNFTEQGSDPAAPAASHWQLFFKAGGLYARKSDGTVLGPFGEGSGGDITVREVDGDPIITGAALVVPNGTLSQDGSGRPQLAPLGVNVQESVDKTPMHALILEFPDGTLTDQGAGVIGYTPPVSGSGPATIFLPLMYGHTVVQGTWALSANAAQSLYSFNYNGASHADGDEITFPICIPAGTYTVDLMAVGFNNYGIVEVYADTDLIATFDGYRAIATYNILHRETGKVVSTDGYQLLHVKLNGKNASSSSYNAGVTAITLHRTA